MERAWGGVPTGGVVWDRKAVVTMDGWKFTPGENNRLEGKN